MANLTQGNVTLGAIRQAAKRASDMQNSDVLTDPEWNDNIGEAIRETYSLRAKNFGQNWAMKEYEFTTDGTNERFNLPVDCWMVSTVEAQRFDLRQGWMRVDRIELEERPKHTIPWGQGPYFWGRSRYYLWGSPADGTASSPQQIGLLPLMQNGWPFRISYVPMVTLPNDTGTVLLIGVVAGDTLTVNGTVFTAVDTVVAATDFLVGETDIATATNLAATVTAAITAETLTPPAMICTASENTISIGVTPAAMESAIIAITWSASTGRMVLTPNAGYWTNQVMGVNGWEMIAVYDAAARALEKQDLPSGVLQGRKQQAIARVTSDSAYRDSGTPPSIADTMGYDSEYGSGAGQGYGGAGGWW